MIAAWMLYVAVVGTGVLLVGCIAEGVLRLLGCPARLIWVAALTLMVSSLWQVSPVPRASPAPDRGTATPVRAAMTAGRGDPHTARGWFWDRWRRPDILVSPDSALARLDMPLLAFWGGSSLLVTGVLLGALLRLRRMRLSARAREVDGVRVLVTESAGPFAVGMWRMQVVVPRWVLDLGAAERRLVLLHEQEHVRARDPALLMGGTALLVIAPWNPALWYALIRLGRAVELDCDRRVLRRRADRRAYAELLLSTAGRAAGGMLPAVGLAAAATFLERRLRLMAVRAPRFLGLRLLAGGAAVMALTGATMLVPQPAVGTSRTGASAGPRAQKPVSALLHIRAVDTNDPHVRFSIFTDTTASVGALQEGRSRSTTAAHLTTPADLSVDLTSGAVHVVCDDCTLYVDAEIRGGPALRASATGRRIVLSRGGSGIAPFR